MQLLHWHGKNFQQPARAQKNQVNNTADKKQVASGVAKKTFTL